MNVWERNRQGSEVFLEKRRGVTWAGLKTALR